MRYFSALWARMYRFSANSRATISSTAIFLSQQSRQYFSPPLGSETSFAPQSAHRDLATDFLGIQWIGLTIENLELRRINCRLISWIVQAIAACVTWPSTSRT